MTDFDSLLPPRTAPPRLPSRGGPAAVMETARARRRRQATKVVGTGGALSVVVLGMTVLRAPAPLHTIEEGPATMPPSVTWTAPPSQTPATLAPHSPPPGEQPAGGQGGLAPTGGQGTGPASPTAVPSAVVPSGPPLLTPDPSPAVRYVRVVREDVADSPAEDCLFHTSAGNPDDVLCTRQSGPMQVPSGTPVDFRYEVCAKTNDVTLRTLGQEEYAFWFTTSSAPDDAPVWKARERPTGVGAHDYEVKAGRCIRYTFQWDGRGDDGRPLATGSYRVVADIPGDWTIEQGATDNTVRFQVT